MTHVLSVRSESRSPLFFMILVACLLTALGDLRNVLTPLGYWVAWAAWAAASLCLLVCQDRRFLFRLWSDMPWPILFAFMMLIAGMLLTALIVPQYLALYQAVKLLVIAFLFLIFLMVVQWVPPAHVVSAICYVLITMAGLFLIAKLWGEPLFIIFGDGRQGMIVAWPGELWKPAVLFLSLLIADLYVSPQKWLRDGACIGICLYLLKLDGSRTGLLLVLCLAVALVWPLLRSAAFRQKMLRPGWVVSCCIVLLVFGMADSRIETSGIALGASDAARQVTEGAALDEEDGISTLAWERLKQGDEDRLSLLRNGWRHAQQCLPFGCGFETTASMSHGIIMPVHNAYLAALGDFGLLGALGMLAFLLVSVWPLWGLWREEKKKPQPSVEGLSARQIYLIGAALGALAFCCTLMLHTFTSEMSEWGFFSLLLAMSWTLMGRKCE
ncbi:O-antigen ligase family protein [Kerstersia gyiorum]|uniref:O-antigen ligase family protein n=1 Tax=Kerstersia gyiorum TaxID=206506 RepID=UPI001070F7E5|nr:O-antigen ligase family protein [Kerstersia gyiorum]MCO7640371.1 hypothetical protein [Pseudomonas sp. S 311-6]MCP1633023.1 hypothetical protein [Kerstersia gyiorum]MCP1636527.1 hypothetical protein [Kerstersia gyiorum]MCP1670220.1 hypothetical protein [Kerstersia gyiorum]MCP1679977.1 hypothetical protein [Kerstersia gyiorum]